VSHSVTFTFTSASAFEAGSADLWILGVSDPASDLAGASDRLGIDLARYASTHTFSGKPGTSLTVAVAGDHGIRDLVLVGVGDRSADALAKAAAKAGREARSARAQSVILDLGDSSAAVLEAFQAGNYTYEPYFDEASRTPAVEKATVIGSDPGLSAVSIRAKWQSWSRDLVNAPPAELYPESLAARAQALASLPHTTVEVWDHEKCEEQGLVGICAVGQGSDRKPVLIHVRYDPPTANDHIAFVGKGVTFDAGGLSIKPSAGMQTMRCDMGGSAVVLGATAAAAEQGLPIRIDCFVGAAENLIDGNSYKLSDILRYRNGVNVEIHNTDAEGRLVMADCLILASEVDGVSAIVDAATLTGACVVALGSDFTGLFTAHDDLANELLAAADANREGLWRLPLHAPYKSMLKAEWATIKNVGSREAGATTAALYLQHFVKEGVPWAHLDVAGPTFIEKGNSRYAAGGTGEMVRSLTTWLEGRAG
jgi:leucyl aminopeptidase